MSQAVDAPEAPVRLHDYQRSGVREILDQLNAGQRVCYCLPTGGGKTYVACGVMRAVKGRILVLAHRQELRNQMAKSMVAMRVAASRVTLLDPSAAKNLSDEELAGFALVIVDEAHRAGGPMYVKLLRRMPSAMILGITATPYRREGLRDVFDVLICGPDVAELCERGVIVEPRCWSVPEDMEPDLRGIPWNMGGDYQLTAIGRAMAKPHLIGNVVHEYLTHALNQSAIVFATTLAHAEKLTAAFGEAGVDARLVTGDTAPSDRRDIIADFDAGRFPVIVNAMLLTEGVDVRRVDCIIMARPTRSLVLFRQIVGRAMRPSPTGRRPIILDHSGAWRRHGSPLLHQEWSLGAPPRLSCGCKGPAPKAKRCPVCGLMMAISAMTCVCGHSFHRVDENGRLVEVADARRRCSRCGVIVRTDSKTDRCVACRVCDDCGARLSEGTSGVYCNRHASHHMSDDRREAIRVTMRERMRALPAEERERRTLLMRSASAAQPPEWHMARAAKAEATKRQRGSHRLDAARDALSFHAAEARGALLRVVVRAGTDGASASSMLDVMPNGTKLGTLYSYLRRLERDGLVARDRRGRRVAWVSTDGDRPAIAVRSEVTSVS